MTDKARSAFGTGIYLSESNKLFLVTAAHCLFDASNTNRLELINSNAVISSFVPKRNKKNIFTLDLKRLSRDGRVKRHASHDVAVIWVAFITDPDTNGTVRFNWLEGVQRFSNPEFALTTASVADNCVLFTNIFDGSETFILGYPAELLNNPMASELNQVDFDAPLIRKGIISQRNQQMRKLIIDSGIYEGNSGGPVLIVQQDNNLNRYFLAGLITRFVPVSTRMFPQAGMPNSIYVNSGYSVVEPIDYALELMRQ